MIAAPIETTTVGTLEAFEAERERWEALERTDREATVFTSWRWLRAYFPVARYRWSILALRESRRAIAYLPIAWGGTPLDRELFLGGNPTADYTGMLVDSAHESLAVDRFADALLRLRWDGFNVHDVRDSRIDRLVERLCERGIALAEERRTNCLTCALPATWEEFINERISAKTRVNTLRVERRLAEALPGFRVSEPDDADIGAHVEAMIEVNHKRWGGNLRNARRRYGGLFRNVYAAGLLRMFVYWDGARPIAAGAAFLDRLQSSFGLYMIGFDEEYAKYSPGKGIVGRAIRAAIDAGYQRFDFLRGDEPFKARYASDVHETRHYRLTRPGLRSAAIAYARPKALALKLAVANLVFGSGRSF